MDGDLSRVWQEIGQLQGEMKTQDSRATRIEDSIERLADVTNKRFDGVKTHLDEQDGNIKQILLNTAKQEGATEQKKTTFDSTFAAWQKIGIVGSILGVFSVIFGKAVWAICASIIGSHIAGP